MLVPVNELQFRSQASRADRENDSSSYHLFNYLLQSGPHKDSRKVTGPYRKRLKDQQLALSSLGELRNKAQLSGLLSSPSPGAADRSAGARFVLLTPGDAGAAVHPASPKGLPRGACCMIRAHGCLCKDRFPASCTRAGSRRWLSRSPGCIQGLRAGL